MLPEKYSASLLTATAHISYRLSMERIGIRLITGLERTHRKLAYLTPAEPGKVRHSAYFGMPVSQCSCLFDYVIGSQHQMSQRIGRLLGGLAAASAFALLATACSSGGSTATDASAQGGAASGVTINFGDQEQEFETLLTASGALKGASYKVNFVEFDSGPLVNAGFAAHRLDVGEMGDLPASLAVKSGLPVTAIAVSLPVGASEFLLAKPGVTTISAAARQAGRLHDGDRGTGVRAPRAALGRTHPEGRAAGQRHPPGAGHGAGLRRRLRVGGQRGAEGRLRADPPQRGDPGHADHGRPAQL